MPPRSHPEFSPPHPSYHACSASSTPAPGSSSLLRQVLTSTYTHFSRTKDQAHTQPSIPKPQSPFLHSNHHLPPSLNPPNHNLPPKTSSSPHLSSLPTSKHTLPPPLPSTFSQHPPILTIPPPPPLYQPPCYHLHRSRYYNPHLRIPQNLSNPIHRQRKRNSFPSPFPYLTLHYATRDCSGESDDPSVGRYRRKARTSSTRFQSKRAILYLTIPLPMSGFLYFEGGG